MSFDYSRIAVVDTETAGLLPHRHPVWEVAVILPDLAVEHVWQQQMWGGMSRWRDHVDPWVAANMPRIMTEYMPSTARSVKSSIDHFAELVQGRHIVGANPGFDVSRMETTWYAFNSSTQPPWHHRTYDVEAMTAAALKQPICGLSDCARALGIEFTEAAHHTALGDARLALAVFRKLME